jgi:hypothetical protein
MQRLQIASEMQMCHGLSKRDEADCGVASEKEQEGKWRIY